MDTVFDSTSDAALVLEDGTMFAGQAFGAVDVLRAGVGAEVVFTTAMTGYQEICTDPSYRGQMVVLTYPLIGNYGIAPEDDESRRPWVSALIVREVCEEYSHWRAGTSLNRYLAHAGIPGLAGLDTRALTRHLRAHGTMRGMLRAVPAATVPLDREALAAAASRVPPIALLDVVGDVAPRVVIPWAPAAWPGAPRVVVMDAGAKQSIARALARRGMEVLLAPYTLSPAELRALAPDGVVISNGPGDPASVPPLVDLLRALLAQATPLLGICLGHQLLGLAAGARTCRLPFGHHGANHPVREVRSGIVTVTSQNHTFQVDAATLPSESGFVVSHVNLSDGSVEGLVHRTLPAFSVQYHPEGAPGPLDNAAIFDRFAALMERAPSLTRAS